jgi:hypothetical protein
VAADTEVKAKRKTGRPSKFTLKLADEICRRISDGASLRSICRDPDMPNGQTVWRWLRENDSFSEQYTRATKERAEAFSEDIIEISDNGEDDWEEVQTRGGGSYFRPNREVIERSKLRVDTRKWLMAKMKPKKYGDKLDVTSDGERLPQPIYGGLDAVKPVQNPSD